MQLTTEAAHFLESQGQALSTGSKCSTEVTHFLESQRQVPSAGYKYSSPHKSHTPWRAKNSQQGPNAVREPLTSWRAKDRHHQQGLYVTHLGSHSHPGETRGIIRRD